MKQKILLLFAILALVSCSNDDSAQANQPDPNKLAFVVFYAGTPSETHWFFNDDGLLTDVKNPNGSTQKHFEYDATGKVTFAEFFGITPGAFTFVYDANGRIASVNGETLAYDQATGTYTLDYENPVVGAEYDYFDRYEFNVDANGELISEFMHYASSDGDYSFDGAHSNIDENGNSVSVWSNGGGSSTSYTYDDNLNPLGAATKAIRRALAVTHFGSYNDKFISGHTASVNNPITQDYAPEDPESHTFTYTYKPNGLPLSCTIQHYYFETFEGEGAFVDYYYQGDVLQ